MSAETLVWSNSWRYSCESTNDLVAEDGAVRRRRFHAGRFRSGRIDAGEASDAADRAQQPAGVEASTHCGTADFRRGCSVCFVKSIRNVMIAPRVADIECGGARN